MDPSLLEIAHSLDPDRIPDKLHCTACRKLLINAFKASCCESSICESCFTNAKETCPVCDHKPFTEQICKPSKAIRNTLKAFLKNIEKTKNEEHIRSAATSTVPVEVTQVETVLAENANGSVTSTEPVKGSTETQREALKTPPISADEPQPSIENHDEGQELHSDQVDGGDDEVEIQVEPSHDDELYSMRQTHMPDIEEDEYQQQYSNMNTRKRENDSQQKQAKDQAVSATQNDNFSMMNNMGFGNMDYNQMMQMLASGGMNSFSSMMGMPMGMMSMPGMFGSFGGPNGGMNGMNGMNMSMGFNQNQGMFGTWNNQNNTWQNNNANGFPNGPGNDFGSQFGFNLNQQQQYSNGDFQPGYYGRGYGRGRGRGRGGYGRGRGNFYQYSQNQNSHFQTTFEQQQQQFDGHDRQNITTSNQYGHTTRETVEEVKQDEPNPDDDEFAPGGQEEVQEALGEDYNKPTPKSTESYTPEPSKKPERSPDTASNTDQKEIPNSNVAETNDTPTHPESVSTEPVQEVAEVEKPAVEAKPIPAAYEEDLENVMPPPSAPLGPSGRYGDGKDYGFRARGHGRYLSRGRGSIHLANGYSGSAARSNSQTQIVASPEPKGTGVVGAPTGPRAMRDPPTKPARTSSGGGFQIMGRAAMVSQVNKSQVSDRVKSPTPNGVEEYKDEYENDYKEDYKSTSQRRSRQEMRESSRYEDQEDDEHDRERDRKRRKSKHDDYDGYDNSREESYSRSDSPDRKSVHRSRREKEKYSSSSKPHSSGSRKYYDEMENGDYDVDDYGEPVQPSRDSRDSESRSRNHRSSKSSKYDDNKYREEKHRDRKRSRHDRDYDEDNEEDDYDSKHRSRRHKKDHHGNYREEPQANGGGRSTSHRSSEAATPVEAEKDPHTLEREARNRERMQKEQQRREKAANADGKRSAYSAGGGGAGGRRVSYKYEDEAERGMLENERATARWR